jgi:AcrR family transcriptional regulator
VPRSGAEARRRLQQAALELYRDHGFDQTTTAEIAARAGVNERTYFRHFPDKREVLFDGEANLREALTQAVAEAPPDLPPLETVLYACRKAAHILEDSRPFSEPRAAVIAATPALRERELTKAASLTKALAEALEHRTVPTPVAALAAHSAWAAFHQAAQSWLEADPSESLNDHLTQTFEALRTLTTPTPRPAART